MRPGKSTKENNRRINKLVFFVGLVVYCFQWSGFQFYTDCIIIVKGFKLMTSIVATIGLCLDMIGVGILYFYGPPIPTSLPDGSELVTYTGSDKEASRIAKLAKRNISISKCALLIIFLGFVLQLVGQFTAKEYHHTDRDNYTNTSNNEIKALEPKPPVEEIK